MIYDRLRRSIVSRLYQRTFETVTGLPLFIESVEPVSTKLQAARQNHREGAPFCRLMTPGGSATCSRCPLCEHESEKNDASERLPSPSCRVGLRQVAAPIRFQNRTVALIRTGPLSLSRHTIETFLTQASSIWMVCPSAKLEAAAKAWLLSPFVSTENLDRCREVLEVFADRLSASINGMLIEDDPRDPEWMRAVKAQERAEENSRRSEFPHDADWNFAFGLAGKMSFREYSDRCRLYRASRLLLNPDNSIETVAESSGFDSVDLFENDFLKLVGESPEDHRKRVLKCDRALAEISGFPRHLPGFGRSLSLQ